MARWRTTIALFFISALLFVVAGEAVARIFWRLRYDVPARHSDRILYAYYPELRKVESPPDPFCTCADCVGQPAHGNGFYNILLLGGSVLHRRFGAVERELCEQLAYLGHRNVRVFNLAESAHTSRDSWLKYAAIGKARFDLVILYDGINDARMNNVPPQVFRDDYAHYSWYDVVNTLAPYHGTALFALPYTLRYLGMRVRETWTSDQYGSLDGELRKDWIQYGRIPRTAAPFERNLKAILDLARQRRDPVLLMTYAAYIPTNYSLEAFKAKRLDYSMHYFPVHLWGAPEHVLATVAVHNDIIRKMSDEYRDVLLVDQAHLVPRSARYFNDVCHLTGFGSAKFVENIVSVLLPRVREQPSGG